MKTIAFITEVNLCIGCGACIAACPQHCIEWKFDKGMYQPKISQKQCVSCGLCAKICPCISQKYADSKKMDAVCGDCISLYNAWSRDKDIRHVSASGGVISTIINYLINQNIYDGVFTVDTYNYDSQLFTELYTKKNLESVVKTKLPKSRYLPVSHENAIVYAKNYPNRKIIIIGSSCGLRAFLNAIQIFGLNRDNYLLIGLFCDKVFNYNSIAYYKNEKFCEGKTLQELHFKNKDSGGWPGNMKFLFSDGSWRYFDKTERIKIKDYFMPERCMYCVDKLNVCADIAVGDNYTQQNSSVLGSNSVIVRTELGKKIWNTISELIQFENVSLQEIVQAQYIEGRLHNFYYAKLKEKEILNKTGYSIAINDGISIDKKEDEYYVSWKYKLKQLARGNNYLLNPQALFTIIKRDEQIRQYGPIRKFILRGFHFLKRHIYKGDKL